MANRYTKQKININRVVELYESGLTQTEVAKELGTTQRVIWQRLKNIKYKCRIAKKRNQVGKNNSSWKGDCAGYKALHCRIYKIKGKPSLCEICGSKNAKRYEWASISRDYSNPNDYIRLCKRCHSKKDDVIKNLRGDAR